MADSLSKSREIFAAEILEKFKGKITGSTDEPVVGENPENKFFVGKLLTKSNDETSYGSDVFIESVGMDFYITNEQIQNAKIKVFPRGEFYYRIYPTLEQQREALLEEANSLSEMHFESFDQLLADYKQDFEKYKKVKIKLLPVYKKQTLNPNDFYVYFEPFSLLDESGSFGRLDEQSKENRDFSNYIDLLKECVNQDELRYTYIINEKTGIADLESQETFDSFLMKYAKQDVVIQQNWSVYIYASVKK